MDAEQEIREIRQRIRKDIWKGTAIVVLVSLTLWAGVYAAYLMNLVGIVPLVGSMVGMIFCTSVATSIYTCRTVLREDEEINRFIIAAWQ
jgi:fatty acid desaturase